MILEFHALCRLKAHPGRSIVSRHRQCEINAADTYQIDFTDNDGNVTSSFFDVQSLLKVRELSSVDGPDGQKATITQDFKDYQKVDGILIPYERTTSGAGLPAPLKMTLKDVKLNSGVEDSMFSVE